jgi:ADP-ribosyl-[dinitrogen reductase] hydrolase
MKTGAPRTSKTHPIMIAEICAFAGMGTVGLTLCPGKKQTGALTGAWDRDLGLDLDAVEAWNAAAVVTLVEGHELDRLKVPQLGAEVLARHIDWYHLPIRDRGVPDIEFEQAWDRVGEGLRARLRAGFNVLVHCMGGLGRAGTIASRLLVELGWDPGEAVKQVREVRPGAIETIHQLDFVNGCSAVLESQPDQSLAASRDRATGALVGLAVGDALGTTLEFSTRDSRVRLTEIVGGGPFRLSPGQWTDDTSMALALGDSLIACGGLDEQDLMSRFVSWWKMGAYSSTGSCFDIGMTVRASLQRFKENGNPIAGSADPMSAGNGSLMRLSPVAIRYWDQQARRRDVAARQSATTHGAAQAVDACVVFADMLADAISGRPRSEVLRSRMENLTGPISEIAAGSWRGKQRSEIHSTGYVAHSLEAAIWSVGRTSSFAEAVLLAANLGGDADTVAAITGQLAGALYGRDAIPSAWLDALHQGSAISDLAEKLFDQSGPADAGQ